MYDYFFFQGAGGKQEWTLVPPPRKKFHVGSLSCTLWGSLFLCGGAFFSVCGDFLGLSTLTKISSSALGKSERNCEIYSVNTFCSTFSSNVEKIIEMKRR